MEGLGPHGAFIVSAYGIVGAVVAGLILWIVLDYRAQQQRLAALEASGVRRRSSRKPVAAKAKRK